MDHALIFASASELALRIRTREVSAAAVVDAYLAQIARHNPTLNAVVILDESGARKRAAEADAALARSELWGPLHGVPITLKDVHDTAGVRSTMGYPPFIERVPGVDSAVAGRLRAAGAVLLGKTNAELFADNPFGRTRNPWDPARSASNSSSGSASALAAGMTALDIGSDAGGSIPSPAHYCGVYGMRPTEHRVPVGQLPTDPVKLWHNYLVLGPMARTVEDLRLALQIIAGPDASDPNVPPVPWRAAEPPRLFDLRIAWTAGFPGAPVAREIRTAIEGLASQLAAGGARVEARLPDLDIRQVRDQSGRLFFGPVGAFGDQPASLASYFSLLHEREALIGAWERFFDDWDVLVFPAGPTTAELLTEQPGVVDGVKADFDPTGDLAAVIGCPSVTIPLGHDSRGLPIGVQLASRRWSDERLLAIAERLSKLTGGFRRPAGY